MKLEKKNSYGKKEKREEKEKNYYHNRGKWNFFVTNLPFGSCLSRTNLKYPYCMKHRTCS